MSAARSRARLFEEMGIGPVWTLRGRIAHDAGAVAAAREGESAADAGNVCGRPAQAGPETPVMADVPGLPPASGQDFAGWEELVEAISHCTRCGLCKTRANTVPGVGDTRAEWLFIGEGPGYHEDQQGEPFVGRSGKLLDNMLAALGIRRGSNAYIANIVKCRASDEYKKDRQPTEEEAAMCMPYLKWQIETINPKVIVALGKTAAVGLLNTGRDISMGAMRGKIHRFPAGDREVPLIVTYHPAYLLRTPMAKKQAWADLCLALDTVETS